MVLMSVMMFVMTGWAAAYTPSSVPNPKAQGQNFYVANPDAIISPEDVDFLNDCALRLDRQTRVEMCVTALGSIGETDCFDFAYELFQRWGIGGEGKNTGVLILFVLDSHDIRIMTGTGIEGVLPDARCSQIIRDQMVPKFREGDYGGGLCLGALRIYDICTDGEVPEELLGMTSVTNRGGYEAEDDLGKLDELWLVGIVIGIGLLFVVLVWLSSIKRCPKCKRRRAHATREKILIAATYAHAGQGERTYHCTHCGYDFVLPFAIPRRSRIVYVSGGGGGFGGGGFSGGGSWGGGSTSGGGAGGKW